MIKALNKKSIIGSDYFTRASAGGQVTTLGVAELGASIKPTSVVLKRRSEFDEVRPARPYMQIRGQVNTIEGRLPYGVSELKLEGDGRDVAFVYEFTDEDLKVLIDKGLFRPGFKVPDVIMDNELVMPLSVEVSHLDLELTDGVPVFFLEIESPLKNVVNEATTGYNFAEYFEEFEIAVPYEEFEEVHEYVPVTKALEVEALPEVEDEVTNDYDAYLHNLDVNVSKRVTSMIASLDDILTRTELEIEAEDDKSIEDTLKDESLEVLSYADQVAKMAREQAEKEAELDRIRLLELEAVEKERADAQALLDKTVLEVQSELINTDAIVEDINSKIESEPIAPEFVSEVKNEAVNSIDSKFERKLDDIEIYDDTLYDDLGLMH